MARVIENSDISKHECEALMLSGLQHVTPEAMQALETRYPNLREWANYVTILEGWQPGSVYPTNLGTEERPDVVIFVNVGTEPTYSLIRTIVKKIVEKLEVKRIALPIPGGKGGMISAAALDPILTAIGGKKVLFDIYV